MSRGLFGVLERLSNNVAMIDSYTAEVLDRRTSMSTYFYD